MKSPRLPRQQLMSDDVKVCVSRKGASHYRERSVNARSLYNCMHKDEVTYGMPGPCIFFGIAVHNLTDGGKIWTRRGNLREP